MYLNAEAQARILTRFQFALMDGGFLLLGKAETLMTHGDVRRRRPEAPGLHQSAKATRASGWARSAAPA